MYVWNDIILFYGVWLPMSRFVDAINDFIKRNTSRGRAAAVRVNMCALTLAHVIKSRVR